MHPAFSVIFFTTASGAGYGILAVLGVMAASDGIEAGGWTGIVGLGLSFVLVTGGLLSSTFHLGHPERAWRALTQWRSSWLSREGVASILTYAPWLVLGYGWIVEKNLAGAWQFAGVLAAAMAALTVYCTAMIYASLKTVHQWSNGLTVPCYLTLALASGAVLVAFVLAVTATAESSVLAFAVGAITLAWLVKNAYWRLIDGSHHDSTPASATGLKGGNVRFLEGPHTEENYLLREMGFRVGRKHADKLRRIVRSFGLGLPLLLMFIAMAGGTIAVVATAVAVVSMTVGMLTERWLFFAEAKHVVTLYYGADAV